MQPDMDPSSIKQDNSKSTTPGAQNDLDQFLKDLGIELPDEVREAAQNPAKAGGKLLLEEIKDSGRRILNGVNQGLQRAGEQIAKTTKGVLDTASSAGKATASITIEQSRKLVRLANDVVGAKPEEQNKLANELIKLAPIVGTYKNYADGWHAFHTGKKLGNNEMVERGRVLCVAAWLVGGIDVGIIRCKLRATQTTSGC